MKKQRVIFINNSCNTIFKSKFQNKQIAKFITILLKFKTCYYLIYDKLLFD